MAQQARVVANVDGAALAEKDTGRGIGPVSKAGGLGVAIAGALATLTVALLTVFGIVVDPVLVATGTTLLGAGLSLLFMYFTPSKKIVEVIEVIAKQDLDSDGTVGPDNTDVGVTPTDIEDRPVI